MRHTLSSTDILLDRSVRLTRAVSLISTLLLLPLCLAAWVVGDLVTFLTRLVVSLLCLVHLLCFCWLNRYMRNRSTAKFEPDLHQSLLIALTGVAWTLFFSFVAEAAAIALCAFLVTSSGPQVPEWAVKLIGGREDSLRETVAPLALLFLVTVLLLDLVDLWATVRSAGLLRVVHGSAMSVFAPSSSPVSSRRHSMTTPQQRDLEGEFEDDDDEHHVHYSSVQLSATRRPPTEMVEWRP